MPEYGLCDKSPEEIEEQKFFQEEQTIFKAAEEAELEAKRRQAAAEESVIRTAETLRQMNDQLQQIQDTQETERQARIETEEHTARETTKREHIDKIRFWVTFVVTLIGSLAAVGSLIATIVLR